MNIKKGQLAMNEELKYQNEKLLPEIDTAFDKNKNKMEQANSRVVKLIQTSSTWSMYLIIILEILLFLFQLVIL
mgnify:FL=1